jgi:hypothetical protein
VLPLLGGRFTWPGSVAVRERIALSLKEAHRMATDTKDKAKRPTFRRGLDHVKRARERAASSFEKNQYLKIEADTSVIIRFLSDMKEVATVYIHERIMCQDGKYRSFVCRQELEDDNGNTMECELCDAGEYRREVIFGLAVLRKAHKDAEGRPDGFEDLVKEIEVEEDGEKKKKPVPQVVIVKQAPRNFWNWFEAFYGQNQTICDRDFEITRRGKEKDTTYMSLPLAPVEIKPPKGSTNWKDRYAKFVPDLDEAIYGTASESYYKKFLHSEDEDAEEAAAASDDDEAARLAAERARLEAAEAGGTEEAKESTKTDSADTSDGYD